jgi:hypothetical protein
MDQLCDGLYSLANRFGLGFPSATVKDPVERTKATMIAVLTILMGAAWCNSGRDNKG